MEKPLNIRLHVISPVHIGCDDVYEPTSFVIDEKRKKLVEFDPMDFIKSLPSIDRQRFSALCMQGNIASIVSIYKFLWGREVKGREVEISNELVSHYKRVRDLSTNDERRIKQELNQFVISRTAYNTHGDSPYIPGSSLKGALRTAYLSMLARDAGIREWWRLSQEKDSKQARELEIKLLGGSFDKDPFRMVKVSDFMPGSEVKTKIVYAVNRKKALSRFEARGPFQLLEAIQEGAVFEGKVNIQQPDEQARIQKPIGVRDLLSSINKFFVPLVNVERKITKEIQAGQLVGKRINANFKGKLGQSSFLVRLGRHSGAEAVTVEGNSHIRIMQGQGRPPKFLDRATTIWLASETSNAAINEGLVPFGWAVLEVI